MVVAVAVSVDEGTLNLPIIKMMLIGSDIHRQPAESVAEQLEKEARVEHQKQHGLSNVVVTSRIQPVSQEYLVELSKCAEPRAVIVRDYEASRM